MKKSLQFLAYLIPILGLGALWYLFEFPFSADAAFFILYGACLFICPFLGLCRLPAFCRGLFYGLSIFAFGGGIPAAMALGGALAAQVVLAVGTLSMGTLFVYFSLPKGTAEETHLALRGMRPARARKTLLLRHSFAFFFEKSGVLAAILTAWQLFIAKSAFPAAFWSAAVLTTITGFIGFLLYLILGAPMAAPMKARPKKGRYIIISLLIFILILIAIYVYVGYAYTSPEPALAAALAALQSVLTPALFAAAVGFFLGMLLGLLFSVCGAHFFAVLCHGIRLIPTALLAGLLYFLLPQTAIPQLLPALTIPLTFSAALRMLQSRIVLRPYQQFPMAGRKKAVNLPLFHLANLSLFPGLLISGLFSAVLLDVTVIGTLPALSELSFVFAASILAVIACILYILCLLTKEVRHHG